MRTTKPNHLTGQHKNQSGDWSTRMAEPSPALDSAGDDASAARRVDSRVLPAASYQLPATAYRLPPTTDRTPHTAYCLPPTTYHLPPTAYHLPPTAYHFPGFPCGLCHHSATLFRGELNVRPMTAIPEGLAVNLPKQLARADRNTHGQSH